MLIDFNDQDPPKGSISSDIYVIGAGPAGILLSLKLAKKGKSVCLLGGGWRKECNSRKNNL